MQENPLSKLHDIKPLVQIPDNSFFIYLALIITIFLFVIILIFLLIRVYKNRKKVIEKDISKY